LNADSGSVTFHKVGFERISVGSLFKIGLVVTLPIWLAFYLFIVLTSMFGGGGDGIDLPLLFVFACATPISAILSAALFVTGAMIVRRIEPLRRFATVEIEDQPFA
jgi:hypothetical protein